MEAVDIAKYPETTPLPAPFHFVPGSGGSGNPPYGAMQYEFRDGRLYVHRTDEEKARISCCRPNSVGKYHDVARLDPATAEVVEPYSDAVSASCWGALAMMTSYGVGRRYEGRHMSPPA